MIRFTGVDLVVRQNVQERAPDTSNIGYYYNAGAIVTEIELDVLTGQRRLVRCDVIASAGTSRQVLLDIGQLEGAMVMGFGASLSERIDFDPTTGMPLAVGLYATPGSGDVPRDMRVHLLNERRDEFSPTGARALSEYGVTLGVSALSALRGAIVKARRQLGLADEAFIEIGERPQGRASTLMGAGGGVTG